jgi:hypothetical protein
MFPRSRLTNALRCGEPRITRDGPSVAATLTIVSAAMDSSHSRTTE